MLSDVYAAPEKHSIVHWQWYLGTLYQECNKPDIWQNSKHIWLGPLRSGALRFTAKAKLSQNWPEETCCVFWWNLKAQNSRGERQLSSAEWPALFLKKQTIKFNIEPDEFQNTSLFLALFFAVIAILFAPWKLSLFHWSKQSSSVLFWHQKHHNEVNWNQIFFSGLLRGKCKMVLQTTPPNYNGNDEHPSSCLAATFVNKKAE